MFQVIAALFILWPLYIVKAFCLESSLFPSFSPDSKFLIDVENVRGRTGFELTHVELLERATLWADRRGFRGRVTLIVDHGSQAGAHWLEENGLAVAFAGPHLKADDLIARDVKFCQQTLGCNVVVITADTVLGRRCHRASIAGRNLDVLCPLEFLKDLPLSVNTFSPSNKPEGNTRTNEMENEHAPSIAADTELFETEMRIKKEIRNTLEAIALTEAHLKTKGRSSRRKKLRLSKQLSAQQRKIAMQTSTAEEQDGGSEKKNSSAIQDAYLDQWEYPGANERMGDRLILAERFRLQIQERIETNEGVVAAAIRNDSNANATSSLSIMPLPAKAYVQYINVVAAPWKTSIPKWMEDAAYDLPHIKKPLRLVVISDTHGYESSLTTLDGNRPATWSLSLPRGNENNEASKTILKECDEEMTRNNGNHTSQLLPEGDVLLHLGDFAANGNKEERMEAAKCFDSWLSRHPHPTKIVIRGNHDPHSSSFPKSGASFVTKPTSISIGGWKLSIVPYIRNCHKVAIPQGDLLATHVPPKRVRDKCNNGNRAGCKILRSAVERMKGGPPQLWLCGHIHEGRGSERVRFGAANHDTLVLNAANANPGHAKAVLHGPVVIDLGGDLLP